MLTEEVLFNYIKSFTTCENIDVVAGWVLGSPETEEGQNRLIAAKNKAVVVSVDYRRSCKILQHSL